MATSAKKLTAEEIAAKKAALPSNQTTTTEPTVRVAPSSQLTPYQQAINNNAGYATPLPQQEREDARLAWIDQHGGPGSISTMGELDTLFKAGTITQDQYDASKSQIQSGLKVNPLGFAANGQRDEAGNIILTSGTKEQITGQQIQDQRAPAAATFSDPRSGAMGQVGSTGFNAGQLTASEQEAVARYARGEGYASAPTPAQVQDYANSIVQSKIDAEKAAQTQRESDRARTANNALSTASSQATTQVNTPEARMNSVSSILSGIAAASGDPMASVYSAMIEQEYRDKIAAEARAGVSYGATVGQANKTYDDTKSLIDRFTQVHREENDKYTELLKTEKDSQQKFLAEQNQRDQDQLSWQQDIETQKLERAKTKQLLQANIQNALGGGSFSGAANEQIASTEREWDTAISNLAKEFSFKKTDVSAMYTQKYIDVSNQFKLDIFNASKELSSKIESYSIQAFNSLQARDAAITQAGNDKRKALDEAAKTYSSSLKEHIKDIQSILSEERNSALNSAIKTGDTIEFIDGLTSDINGNKFISDARAVDTRFRAIQSQMDQIKQLEASGDTAAKNFADQQLINLFNKMVDPSSVVRESEFARSAQGLSLVQQIEAGVRRITEGGVLEPKAREELFNAAQTLQREYNSQLQRDLQPYIARINLFNSQDGVQTKVKITDVIPSNLIPQVPQATLDMWKSQMGGGQASLGSSETLPGFRTDAPTNGFRTDRHNNPTAFTIDIARQGGLVEGIDYEVGDAFPNNPNMKTARIIGDPIAKTIEVIDKIGFYTKGGQQRWLHTAMPKESWDSMTYGQKSQIIAQMYQREGGTGVLVGDTQVAYSPNESAFSVPKASASEPSLVQQQAQYQDQRDQAMQSADSFTSRLGSSTARFGQTFARTTGEAAGDLYSLVSGLGGEFFKGFSQEF